MAAESLEPSPLLANLARYVEKELLEEGKEEGQPWSACLISLPGETESLEDYLESSINSAALITARVDSVTPGLAQAVLIFSGDSAATECAALTLESLKIEGVLEGVYKTEQTAVPRMAKSKNSTALEHAQEMRPVTRACCGFLCLGTYSTKRCRCQSRYKCNEGGRYFYIGGCRSTQTKQCRYSKFPPPTVANINSIFFAVHLLWRSL